ncbi:MAG: hypothetical protein PQJ58_01510 [Spirochaetales bacterium]|nr:hypothetical protein [Spirochaetales bacterium]
MKKTLAVTALVLMSTAALFANGNKDEETQEYYGRGGGRPAQGRDMARGDWDGPRGPFMEECDDEDGNWIEPEQISAEGTLVLEEGTLPYLNTDSGKVFLMVPPFAMADLELEGGESVAVTGYDMPTDRWGNETESTFIRVLTAEIDGEELDLAFDRMGGRSRGGKGGRGPQGGRFDGSDA